MTSYQEVLGGVEVKVDQARIEEIIAELKPSEFKWIDPRRIIVSHWVRMKCRYGCSGYGKSAVCPPHNPPVEECRSFFHEYRDGVILRFRLQPVDPRKDKAHLKRLQKNLAGLEREVFLAGYERAFVISTGSCGLCGKECTADPASCRHPDQARPSPEGMGMDVYGTVKQAGLPIEVCLDRNQVMNRYAFLLVR